MPNTERRYAILVPWTGRTDPHAYTAIGPFATQEEAADYVARSKTEFAPPIIHFIPPYHEPDNDAVICEGIPA